MKIGIDLDGVVFNSEKLIKFYADQWSHFVLHKNKLKNNEVEPEKCYDWTNDEINEFYNTYFDKATQECELMAGAKEILEQLKKDGHQIYIITYRGEYREQEIIDAKALLSKINIKFDGIYWGVYNKMKKCEELGIDIYIDDNPGKVEQFSLSSIKVLYFQDTGIRNINQRNVTIVHNWMDIYKEIIKAK